VPLRNSRIIQVVCDAPDAPLAADLANTLAETFIEQNVESRQRLARQTYESLTLQLAEMRHVLLLPEAREFAQPDPAGTRDLLNPEANANRRFYEAMLQKANDARMASLVRQSNIRLVSAAQPAALPYKPNLPLTLAIGAIGGLIVAFGCVLLYEQNMSALHAPGEAGTYLGLPELGAIPNDRARIQPARGLLTSTVRRPPVDRAVLDQWPSHLSESFRGMLASILAADRHGRLSQTLVVTSSRPMEGKTTVVSNLGIAIAETGSKVLLIDGDGRRPHLHKIFDQANGCGLSDVLREGSAIDELPLDLLVRKTPVPNLYLLPSGAATDNMSGLLHSDRMSQLFTRIRDEFDFVLLDSPPCLEFADARNLARYADGLLFVVRANYTDRKTAQAAVQRLQSDGICITGVILNRWDLSRGDLYGYPAFGGFGRQEVA
jgi:receptor protein-tyrosine kinase